MRTVTPRSIILIDRQLGHVAGLLAALGAMATVVLMLVTVVSVFWRYALRAPIFGIEDVSTMALSVAVAGAVSWGARHDAHISVNVISIVGGRRLTRLTDVVVRILGVAIVSTAAYALFVKGGCGKPCGSLTNNMGIVHTPFYYLLSFSLATYSAMLLLQLIVGILHWNGDDPNEVVD